MPSNRALTLVFPAFGAALIAVLSQITIPIGTVPFTLQTLAVGLVASTFRFRDASLSILVYWLLGAIGLPVFAGGAVGISAFVTPTAGFLWGFIAYACVTSYLCQRHSSLAGIFISNLLGDALAFVCGVIGLHFLADMTWKAAWLTGVLPFLLPELGKIVVISLISQTLRRSLQHLPYFQAIEKG